MFNLIRLLIEEPKKIERLILLLIKGIITFYIAQLFFINSIPLDISNYQEFKAIHSLQLILFIAIFSIIWYVLWSLIVNLIAFSWIVNLFTPKATRTKFYNFLKTLDVLDSNTPEDSILPGKNIVFFYETLVSIEKKGEEWDDAKTRAANNYMLFLGAFIAILLSPSGIISTKIIIWGILFISFFFFNCIFLNYSFSFIEGRLEALINEFGQLSYPKRLLKHIEQINLVEKHYLISQKLFKIHLTLKDKSKFPQKIEINPLFHWNPQASMPAIIYRLKQKNNVLIDENEYIIVASNVKLDEKGISLVNKQKNFVYIYLEDEKEIYYKLEEFLFKVQLSSKKSLS